MKLLYRIIALIGSIIVSLVLMESFLHFFKIAPPIFNVKKDYVKLSENPVLGYELNPENQNINSYGLLKPEFSMTKTSKRIVALGDSITFGCCVYPPYSGYPRVLQNLLSFQKVEVINAGILGYNTIQEAELFKQKIVKLKPDILIIQVTLNDWMPKTFEYEYLLETVPEKQRSVFRSYYNNKNNLTFFLMKSRLVQFLRYYSIAFKQNYLASLKQKILGNVGNKKNISKVETWRDSLIIDEGFNQINNRLEPQLKGKVLVVIFPEFRNNLTNYDNDNLQETEYILMLAKKYNFESLDLRKCYEDDFNEKHISFIRDDVVDTVHPTQYGHEVAAGCIAKKLIDLKW